MALEVQEADVALVYMNLKQGICLLLLLLLTLSLSLGDSPGVTQPQEIPVCNWEVHVMPLHVAQGFEGTLFVGCLELLIVLPLSANSLGS